MNIFLISHFWGGGGGKFHFFENKKIKFSTEINLKANVFWPKYPNSAIWGWLQFCRKDSVNFCGSKNFFKVFLNQPNLHNLIKKLYMDNNNNNNQKTQIHKVLQYKFCEVQLCLLLVLLNKDGQWWTRRISEFLISFLPLGLISFSLNCLMIYEFARHWGNEDFFFFLNICRIKNVIMLVLE